MIGSAICVLLLIFLILHLYKTAYKRPCDGFPPGPPNLPIYGAYWIIRLRNLDSLQHALIDLAKEYKTKVLGMIMGPVSAIVIDDPALIKECLNREELDGRMDIILGRLRSYWKRLGIFFTDDYFWHVQRRFSLRYMRDFGFGRRDESLETVMENEIKEMIDMRISGPKYPAEKEIVKGELIHLPDYFSVPFINGMFHVLAQITVPRSEYHKLWELGRRVLLFQRSSNDFGGAISYTPWIKNFFPNLSGFNGLRHGNQGLLDIMEKLIPEMMATQEESHDRNFLDVYIRKMKEEQKEKKRTTFTVEQLTLICTDYMFPAASAVQQVLSMLIERMLIEPEIQDKIHEEIDRVIGRDRMPNLDDRKDMPYTEACIRELLRIEPLVPLGVPHRAMKDTVVGGYNIPENTMVTFNYQTLHHSKEMWGDPEKFRPERFIVGGKLQVSNDKSLPFGAGRRLCAGETFARQGMFQVFAAFMQAFHVSTADGRPLKKFAPRIQGIITSLPESWVRVMPRT